MKVADDGLSVRLVAGEMTIGHVQELTVNQLQSTDQEPLLHNAAYYTLNYLPN